MQGAHEDKMGTRISRNPRGILPLTESTLKKQSHVTCYESVWGDLIPIFFHLQTFQWKLWPTVAKRRWVLLNPAYERQQLSVQDQNGVAELRRMLHQCYLYEKNMKFKNVVHVSIYLTKTGE